MSSKKNKKKSVPRKVAFVLGGINLLLLAILGIIFLSDKMVGSNNNNIDNSNNTTKTNDNNVVVLDTSMGEIEIELFLEKSPITAGNFKKLVEEGFYDKTKFHRVIKNFMIQGGDPLTKDDSMQARWGTGGPGYVIKDEFIPGLSNLKGTIAMANSGPNSGGSQFFINMADNTFLDWDKQPQTSKHPVFGKVVKGMDVVEKIINTKTTGAPYDRPLEPITIEKAYMK